MSNIIITKDVLQMNRAEVDHVVATGRPVYRWITDSGHFVVSTRPPVWAEDTLEGRKRGDFTRTFAVVPDRSVLQTTWEGFPQQ